MGIAKLVPGIRKELERQRAEIAKLARRIAAVKEGSVRMSGFLEVRSMVSRYETENVGLRQARLDKPSPTVSRGPVECSRLPVPIYSGDRSTLPNFLKLFERRLWRMTQKRP